MTDDVGQPPPAETRQLKRSSDDKIIAGVCGGLAAYLDVDTILIRLVAVVLGLTGGAAVIGYVVAWVVLPQARPGELRSSNPHESYSTERMRFLAGAVLIAIGGLVLIGLIIPGLLASRLVWPVALVVLGLFLVLRRGTKP